MTLGGSHGEAISAQVAAINRDDPLPLYVQLKDALRERIESGVWKPGDRIPGESDLCQIFDVSRTVVLQALKELSFEGLIVRRQGKGTFVAEPKIGESLVQKLTGFYQDMQERGLTPVTQVLKQARTSATAKVAARLGLQPGQEVIEIERLRFVDGDPIVLVTTFLPHHLCSQLLEAELSRQSLYAYLERSCGLVIARGRRTIEAVPASSRDAELLRVEPSAPLIRLVSVSYLADGTPLEYYEALHRGDRSRFEVELIRIREQGHHREALGEGQLDLPPGTDLVPPAGKGG